MGRKLWDESTDGIGATSGVSPWGIILFSRRQLNSTTIRVRLRNTGDTAELELKRGVSLRLPNGCRCPEEIYLAHHPQLNLHCARVRNPSGFLQLAESKARNLT